MEAEGTEREIARISFGSERPPRDLLRRFAGVGDDQPSAARGDSGEIDLSLCLSLGGSLSASENLVRSSSSIASLMMLPRAEDFFPAVSPIMRTYSLPTEVEENRKRKEMQSLKRREAKRKRSERSNLWPAAAEIERAEEGSEEFRVQTATAVMAKVGKDEVELSGCPGFPGSAQFGGPVNGVPPALAAGTVDVTGSFPPISQGSIGSQGSSTSGVTNFESRPMQGFEVTGFSSCTEAKNLSTVGRAASRKAAGEKERNMMEEMPCVSTKGEGPNGRRIEGFLYKYRKGEEVRIVCVCHGSFLSPAEFIRHAGGGDVAHPLKHIVVSPFPSAFL